MNINGLILRGYAKKDDENGWYAICLELNLLAQGDTKKQVMDKLESMIDDYVKEAFTIDRDHFEELMKRHAPLYFYAQYYWLVLKSKFYKTLNNNANLISQPLPLLHG